MRNDDYWNGDVYLEEIEFVIQTDPARRADQLLAGELDVMHTSDPETIKQLREERGINRFEEDRGEEGFVMINTQAPPFDDIRARKALTLATPEAGLPRDHRAGHPRAGRQHVQRGQPYYNPEVKQEADDPEGARSWPPSTAGRSPPSARAARSRWSSSTRARARPTSCRRTR